MEVLSKALLLVSVIIFVVALVLSFVQTNLVAGPNGWLDLSLTLAVISCAIKYVHN
ncbi:MAG: hypothetical protein HOC71_01480 [Candidatus Latescibacteria bacterium]|jgi:hypothetical protein|nr:hypothetical protein [Candidatus Latescibacterota bacterium]